MKKLFILKVHLVSMKKLIKSNFALMLYTLSTLAIHKRYTLDPMDCKNLIRTLNGTIRNKLLRKSHLESFT